MSPADAAEIANLCVAAGCAEMAAELLAAGVTVDQARERVDHAGQIRHMAELVSRSTPDLDLSVFIDAAIRDTTPVSEVRTRLLDMLADRDETNIISGHQPARDASAPPTARTRERPSTCFTACGAPWPLLAREACV